MKRPLCTAVILLSMIFVPQPGYSEDDFLIFNSTNEADIENQIGMFLQKKHDWSINYRRFKKNPDDVYLSAVFTFDGNPDMRLIIDTLVYIRDKSTEEIKGRKVKISVYRANKEDKGMFKNNQDEILRIINTWIGKKSYLASCYIDGDGDLRLRSFLTVENHAPLHIEQVDRAIDNIIDCWVDIHNHLKEKNKI